MMNAEDYYRARDIQSVTGETLPAGRGLRSGELSALINVCAVDPTPAGARDAAIIALMIAAVLRREEVVNLDADSYDRETRQLIVFDKRSKERTAYLTNGAAAAMTDWLAIRASEPGPLFLAINKGGHIIPGRMTTQAVYNMLIKRAGQAKVKKFSPHDLRRSFVSDLLDARYERVRQDGQIRDATILMASGIDPGSALGTLEGGMCDHSWLVTKSGGLGNEGSIGAFLEVFEPA